MLPYCPALLCFFSLLLIVTVILWANKWFDETEPTFLSASARAPVEYYTNSIEHMYTVYSTVLSTLTSVYCTVYKHMYNT